jgi:hypothetical protein
MIQEGKLRGFAMGQAIPVRTDCTAGEVRRLAQRAKDAAQARRLLAIAAVLEGHYGDLLSAKFDHPHGALRCRLQTRLI